MGPFDGIVLDIGVSSMQLDQPERGFSFRFDGPLDMRMERAGRSAADLVNELEAEPLANLLYLYGEERASRRIARAIVAERAKAPIPTTAGWPKSSPAPRRASSAEIHPATRSFQALRIAVNEELDELTRRWRRRERLLRPGGRLAVVTFHSLEDRIVKHFFAERAGRGRAVSRLLPGEMPPPPSTFILSPRPADRGGAAGMRAQPARPLGQIALGRAHRRAASDKRRRKQEKSPTPERDADMLRILNVLAIVVLVGSAVYAYSIKYATLYQAERMVKLKHELQKEKDCARHVARRMGACRQSGAHRDFGRPASRRAGDAIVADRHARHPAGQGGARRRDRRQDAGSRPFRCRPPARGAAKTTRRQGEAGAVISQKPTRAQAGARTRHRSRPPRQAER